MIDHHKVKGRLDCMYPIIRPQNSFLSEKFLLWVWDCHAWHCRIFCKFDLSERWLQPLQLYWGPCRLRYYGPENMPVKGTAAPKNIDGNSRVAVWCGKCVAFHSWGRCSPYWCQDVECCWDGGRRVYGDSYDSSLPSCSPTLSSRRKGKRLGSASPIAPKRKFSLPVRLLDIQVLRRILPLELVLKWTLRSQGPGEVNVITVRLPPSKCGTNQLRSLVVPTWLQNFEFAVKVWV